MIRDRSLVRLQVRDDTRYVSHGSAVLATRRDGWLDAAPEQGFFVDQTRMLSRHRCLLGGREPILAGISGIGQNSSLGYYIVAAPDGSHPEIPGSVEEASQHSIELKISRVLGGGMHEDLDVANFSGGRVRLQLVLEIEADFADQDETRGERQQRGELAARWSSDGRREGDGGDCEHGGVTCAGRRPSSSRSAGRST